jgi:hypothetical protein
MHATALRLAPSQPPPAGGRGASSDQPDSARDEELSYRVDLWDRDRTLVERVLAVTSSSSIGFAAFHAAAREYPDRYITLRHRGSMISQWNSPAH